MRTGGPELASVPYGLAEIEMGAKTIRGRGVFLTPLPHLPRCIFCPRPNFTRSKSVMQTIIIVCILRERLLRISPKCLRHSRRLSFKSAQIFHGSCWQFDGKQNILRANYLSMPQMDWFFKAILSICFHHNGTTLSNKLLICTVEPLFNEIAGDRPNSFIKSRVCYIKVLCHIFNYSWGKECRSLYRGSLNRASLNRGSTVQSFHFLTAYD